MEKRWYNRLYVILEIFQDLILLVLPRKYIKTCKIIVN